MKKSPKTKTVKKKNTRLPDASKTRSRTTKQKQDDYYVICVGASAGGLNAVTELLSQLPSSLPAAVFVVLHLSGSTISNILIEKIRKRSKMNCLVAENDLPIQPGTIYISPPGVHLLMKEDRVVIGHGPPENRFRPSIDVLFRAAAASYTGRVIGIVLTGFLNDGSAGMWAIQQSGGHCIVQDPEEAEYPDMPLSVLDSMEVDYSLPLKEMGKTIEKIISKREVRGVEPPSIVSMESRLSEKAATSIEHVSKLGDKTVIACPDCGGGLWSIKNGHVKHYRCHIGHSYSERDLVLKLDESIEHTLWVALRMMEERKLLMSRSSAKYKGLGLQYLGKQYAEQSISLEDHIQKLKDLLFTLDKGDSPGIPE